MPAKKPLPTATKVPSTLKKAILELERRWQAEQSFVQSSVQSSTQASPRAEKLFARDPIDILDRSLEIEDLEIASFLAAGLSYGRVEQIYKSIENLFFRLENLGLGKNARGISGYLKRFNPSQDADALADTLAGWKHRLNTEQDLNLLFHSLARILKNYRSLCHLFQAGYHENSKNQISLFCQQIRSEGDRGPRKRSENWKGTGLSWFASDPNDGGTSKRLMMWLRWMIRKDAIDLGLWQNEKLLHPTLPKPHSSRIFYPVDTHIFKWAQANQVIRAKTPNWKTTEAITEFFKNINAEDPVRFDFLICHLGMTEFRKPRIANSKQLPKAQKIGRP